MADAAELVVRITGDIDDIERKLDRTGRSASTMGDKFESAGRRMGGVMADFGKVAALGLGAAAVGVGAFLKSAVDAAEESRKVMAQTNAVIESTGGVANVTAQGVGKLADKLAAMSGIDDEVIAGGQNMLLTFTQVRNQVGKGNDVFDQATKAALNMSVALGTDMKGASMLVGKALNDPIAGLTALTRSGIQFTASQKDQIKAMVAAGDVMGAQKIILKELETQFGGSAEAAASPMARLKVVVGNLQEELGARLLPVVGKVATFLADKLPGAIDRVTGLFGGLFNIFVNRDFTGEFGRALGVEEDSPIVAKIFAFRDKFMGVVDAIVGWVRTNWPQIKLIISETMETVGAVIAGVVDVITTIWDNFGSQIMDVARGAWESVKSTIQAALDIIQGIVKVVTGIIHGDWGQVWEGIKQILAGAWEFITGKIEFFMTLAKNLISIGWEIVKGIFSSAWEGIKGLAADAWDALKDGVSSGIDRIIEFVSELPGKILGALGDLAGMLWDAGWKIMMGLKDGIVAGLGAVKDFVSGIAGKIISWKGPPEYDARLLVPAGMSIMDSLVDGLRAHEKRLAAQLAQTSGMIGAIGTNVSVSPGAAQTGGIDYERLAAAIVSALKQAGMGGTNVFPPGSDPMHVAREIAWRTGG